MDQTRHGNMRPLRSFAYDSPSVVPSSADLAALVEALLLRGLRPARNVTRDGKPGSKSAIYRVGDRALSGCEAAVSVGSALWRFAALASSPASGLALRLLAPFA